MARSAPHPRSESGTCLCPQISPRVFIPAPQHALCPQVCVSSCPEFPWTVEMAQLSQTVGQVFYAANRNFCLPGVPGDMVSAVPNVIAKEGP